MKIRIATWNINSVRLRLSLVEAFARAFKPHVLCLQEIKCRDADFPHDAMKALGFDHVEVHGQAGYHGVATLSKLPLARFEPQSFCGTGEARHLPTAITLNGRRIVLHNVYVPSGGDIPDPDLNPKFRLKLTHLEMMAAWFADPANQHPDMVLAGDFNVAPLVNDVWSHKQLLNVVSHTPVEVAHLEALQRSPGWIDAVRLHIPPERKLFTWWSYRARDWKISNRGRRLDHIWTTPSLSASVYSAIVVQETRGWLQPSDHVPVIADLKLD